MATVRNRTGLRYGTLVVTGFDGHRIAGGKVRTFWKCRCDCGEEIVRQSDCLKPTNTCGGFAHTASAAALKTGVKACWRCKESMPLTEFAESSSTLDGRKGQCRKCVSVYMGEYGKRPETKAREKSRSASAARKEYAKSRNSIRTATGLSAEYYRRPEVKVRRSVLMQAEKYKAMHIRAQANRRARKKGLAADWTELDRLFAICYFRSKCAICKTSLKSHDICWDHWIPLKSSHCPGTIPGNMIPLCRTCNSEKNARMPAVYLRDLFGRFGFDDLAEVIEEDIRFYFQTTRLTESGVVA